VVWRLEGTWMSAVPEVRQRGTWCSVYSACCTHPRIPHAALNPNGSTSTSGMAAVCIRTAGAYNSLKLCFLPVVLPIQLVGCVSCISHPSIFSFRILA
jgi:hypothetical protein